MRLSQQDDNNTTMTLANKKDYKGAKASAADSKLKASNFPATILKIGTWEVCYLVVICINKTTRNRNMMIWM